MDAHDPAVPEEDARLSDFVDEAGSADDDGAAERDRSETDEATAEAARGVAGGAAGEGPTDDPADSPDDDVGPAGVHDAAAESTGVHDDPAESAGASDNSGVDPAVPTATWAPDGACEDCGATVRRRWRDGDVLVCADCKDW